MHAGTSFAGTTMICGICRRTQPGEGGNRVRYRANKSCPIYDELRGMLKKIVKLSTRQA
jgi:hypothetical protein